MSVEERFELEREDYRHESPQARLAGRLKLEFCHWCGRPDGMKSVHRETLEEISSEALLPPILYREPGNSEYLFYPCPDCNRQRIIPADFISVTDVQAWLDRDPMAPDYDALAAEPEQVSQITDARDSAGMEG